LFKATNVVRKMNDVLGVEDCYRHFASNGSNTQVGRLRRTLLWSEEICTFLARDCSATFFLF